MTTRCNYGRCGRPARPDRKSCAPCAANHAAYAKRYYHANKEKANTQTVLRKYGLTQDDYDAMLATQGGGCAICRGQSCTTYSRLSVDHCHETGKVRGLLCNNCNRAIGLLRDDPDLLAMAGAYLRNAS